MKRQCAGCCLKHAEETPWASSRVLCCGEISGFHCGVAEGFSWNVTPSEMVIPYRHLQRSYSYPITGLDKPVGLQEVEALENL